MAFPYIDALEKEIAQLKIVLSCKELELENLKKSTESTINSETKIGQESILLQQHKVSRYSRQLILPEIGVKGQSLLAKSRVLVVGCGGLGCPAAIYLAAAGVAKIGLVDSDVVELSNLHRQILHSENLVGFPKVFSALNSCLRLNSKISVEAYEVFISHFNASDIIADYDIVLDCTDNVATRYLLNDACVLSRKVLISGSALRFEGQLTIYNAPLCDDSSEKTKHSPCYRCLHPTPPPADTVTNCSDGGILGVVPGLIGTLQALEAIKLIIGLPSTYAGSLLLFDSLSDHPFRKIRLRAANPQCAVCGENPSIKCLQDYELLCGTNCSKVSLLKANERVSIKDYQKMCFMNEPHLLIDVRPAVETEICKLPNSFNFPLTSMTVQIPQILETIKNELKIDDFSQPELSNKSFSVITVCRLGNDSQKAVHLLKKMLPYKILDFKDIEGGLYAWNKHIDSNFLIY